jgi:hypothetical protein
VARQSRTAARKSSVSITVAPSLQWPHGRLPVRQARRPFHPLRRVARPTPQRSHF